MNLRSFSSGSVKRGPRDIIPRDVRLLRSSITRMNVHVSIRGFLGTRGEISLPEFHASGCENYIKLKIKFKIDN